MRILIKALLVSATLWLVGQVARAQQEDLVNADFNSLKIDDDSLYYDDLAYLDHYRFWDNIFLLGQLGISHSMSENTRFGNFFDNERLSFNVGMGKMIYPAFGLRFTAGLHPQVGRANWELCEYDPQTFGNYNYNMLSVYLDGIISLTNVVLKYREDRVFDLRAIVGLGFNHVFGFDKAKCDLMRTGIGHGESGVLLAYDVNTTPGNYFAAHLGLQGVWKVNDAWDIALEATFNGTDDKYNGHHYDRVYDTYVELHFGVQYHLRDSHGRRRFHYVKNLSAQVLDRLAKMQDDENERLNEANLAVPEIFENFVHSKALQTTISFYVDRHYITDAQKKNVKSVANFLATHPDINLIVTGYADIETAYPEYNMRLSKKRSQAVYDMLVNEFHVPENRLRIDFKGDTVQPYAAVNEWNRAVIFFLDRGDGSSQILKSEAPQEDVEEDENVETETSQE